uniref:carnitine O-palmitoyltransferase n=1 Tax=Macrostomum lignano TaxID=282301 RepID=A0A1I8H8H2_9PLAT
MAEAHQAVVFAFNITDQGVEFEFDHDALLRVWASGVRAYKKWYARFKNRLRNGIYPAKPSSLLTMMLVMIFATMFGNDLSFGYVKQLNPLLVRYLGVVPPHDTYASCALIACILWLLVVLIYKLLIGQMLAYHGWMYEARGRVSRPTKVWAVLAKTLLRNRRPGLFSFQNSLPRLPLPSVGDTVRRYLVSMESLLGDEEMLEMRRLAAEFQVGFLNLGRSTGIARKLQFYLRLKSWWAPNYVSDWWEEFVYLYSRDPIMVNSNYYAVDAIFVRPTRIQAARAANVSWAMLQFWRRICREEMPPILLNDTVPLCSWQYERQFATTRIPGEERDYLMHLNDTRHIAVFHSGRFYKVYFHYGNRWLEPCELEAQFQRIVDDKSPPAPGEAELAALTAGERKVWARARKDFFRRGVNKTSLDAVERAAFVLVLDDEEADYDPKDDSKLDHFAKSLLHGNGRNRWFDKSFSLIVFANGRIGVNAEHSWADAPVMSQLWEEAVITYDIVPDTGYTATGHCKGTPKGPVPNPIRLQWDLNDACRSVIASQLRVATDLLNDVDLHLVVHRQFGKGAMKRCSMSPDAFIQLALQLAYFRDSGGEFCLTYEASMTRLFKEGRTETVRSCTNESCAFVRAMESGASVSFTCGAVQLNEEVVRLLRQASEKHQTMYRDAMTGKGVDRHLFTLYVVSKYCKTQSPFLEKALHCQWKLSTSQTPHGQTSKMDLHKNPDFLSAGGGFGPVSHDGYGVSYIIAGEDTVFFHVSSRVSSDK